MNCEPMASIKNKLILWVGEKHCGKTTSAAELVRRAGKEGFKVSGLLAPCVYRDNEFIGFDVLDLRSSHRTSLARCKDGKAGPFDFISGGLKLGDAVLSLEETRSADLIVVDEFGPLELKGNGWRKSVDSLLTTSDAIILLVVRRELVDAVRQLYAKFGCRELAATEAGSIEEAITMLKNRCGHIEEQGVKA